MKIAVVHSWWLSNRGGESVIKAIIELYPSADLFFHVCDEKLIRQTLPNNFLGSIKTTFISKLPGAKKHYQKYLPLMPLALEALDLTQYDLIISSEAGPAKGVITRPDALHICYCHSPMRYIWDMYYSYLKDSGIFIRFFFPYVAHKLRLWDLASAARVDKFIANSSFVATRIKKFYRRNSELICPPVDVNLFDENRPREDFYLCLGQLVKYKRADMVVDVFNKLKLPLVVIGEGELYEIIKKNALSNITIMGRQSFDVVKDHLERCKALVFPGLEDFGIVPVEAMASGAPVIAYGRGGVLDTVLNGVTGILFNEQSHEALEKAVRDIQNNVYSFDVTKLKAHAMNFDKSIFKNKFRKFVQDNISINNSLNS